MNSCLAAINCWGMVRSDGLFARRGVIPMYGCAKLAPSSIAVRSIDDGADANQAGTDPNGKEGNPILRLITPEWETSDAITDDELAARRLRGHPRSLFIQEYATPHSLDSITLFNSRFSFYDG